MASGYSGPLGLTQIDAEVLSDDLGLQDVLPAAVKDDGVAAEHVEDVAQTERQLQILLDEQDCDSSCASAQWPREWPRP